MTTIRDVAVKAGVGVGTVSRVINGAPGVSSRTRDRVERAIDALGYRPSPAARALSRGRASTIAVTAPFLTRPSVVERLRGVVAGLDASEYDLSLATVETPEQRRRRIVGMCQRDRADGAILISLPPTVDEARMLRAVGVPVVVVDGATDDFASITTDDVAGGRLATEHLLELGHRRIAFVGDEPDERFAFTSSDDRLAGYRDALRDAGIDADPDLVVTGPHGREAAAGLAGRLLDLADRPTAVFTASDTQALGVLEAARSRGLDVPGDLSVVGFDDIELAELMGLTTVRQPLFESGRRAAELLLRLLGRDAAAEGDHVELALTLVPRHTTGRPRGRTTRRRPAS